MNKFVIKANGENYYPKVSVYSGGEVNVRLPDNLPQYIMDDVMVIKVKLKSSEDVMALVMLMDALRGAMCYLTCRFTLHMAYVPYARQDRICNKGEALSIRAFSQIINMLDFNRVIAQDNHSDVATALINNCYNIPPEVTIGRSNDLVNILTKTKITLCSPDAGANKKTLNIAKAFGGIPVIRADKSRDVSTGKITGTEVYCDDLNGQTVLIVDDICDGGRTFIELAKKLVEKNAGVILLYVTHGIFSKGIQVLLDSGIQAVYTTDSFTSIEDRSESLKVIKL